MLITCSRCTRENVEAHKDSTTVCDDCVKANDSRISYYRQHNSNWIEIAKEAGLELWERQPSETDHEYHVWLHYRDCYPGRRPTYQAAAESTGTSVVGVRKIAARWDFQTRIQAWARYVDEITLAKRRQEIEEMNKAHVDMAAKARSKLALAIDRLNPDTLGPKDIAALTRVMTELERKARLDDVPTVDMTVDADNPDVKKSTVKPDQITDVVDILMKAGVFNAKGVGVRQTVTTEVVVNDDAD